MTEVAIRADGCAKCGNAESMEAYKRKVGAMPPPLPPAPPQDPPLPPPPPPPSTPPPKSEYDQAVAEYTKLDRYWRALKQQRTDREAIAKQAGDDKAKAEDDLEFARGAVKALDKASAADQSKARELLGMAEKKCSAARTAEAEKVVLANGARQKHVEQALAEAKEWERRVGELGTEDAALKQLRSFGSEGMRRRVLVFSSMRPERQARPLEVKGAVGRKAAS